MGGMYYVHLNKINLPNNHANNLTVLSKELIQTTTAKPSDFNITQTYSVRLSIPKAPFKSSHLQLEFFSKTPDESVKEQNKTSKTKTMLQKSSPKEVKI